MECRFDSLVPSILRFIKRIGVLYSTGNRKASLIVKLKGIKKFCCHICMFFADVKKSGLKSYDFKPQKSRLVLFPPVAGTCTLNNVIVPGGCYLSINMIHKIDRKIEMPRTFLYPIFPQHYNEQLHGWLLRVCRYRAISRNRL